VACGKYDDSLFTLFALSISMVDFLLQTARLLPVTENLPMSHNDHIERSIPKVKHLLTFTTQRLLRGS
jgi:hypothetical protein